MTDSRPPTPEPNVGPLGLSGVSPAHVPSTLRVDGPALVYVTARSTEQPAVPGAAESSPCSCDADPIECSHEAACGEAEETLAEVRRLCELTIATSFLASAIAQAQDTLAILDRRTSRTKQKEPLPMPDQPRPPVPLLDGERAQEHDDLTRQLAGALATWQTRVATVCAHTQLVSYGEAAEAMMMVVGPRLEQLRDQYEQLYGQHVTTREDLERRTSEWKAEQAALVGAEQATIAADQRAGQLHDALLAYATRLEDGAGGRAVFAGLAREMRTVAGLYAAAASK